MTTPGFGKSRRTYHRSELTKLERDENIAESIRRFPHKLRGNPKADGQRVGLSPRRASLVWTAWRRTAPLRLLHCPMRRRTRPGSITLIITVLHRPASG